MRQVSHRHPDLDAGMQHDTRLDDVGKCGFEWRASDLSPFSVYPVLFKFDITIANFLGGSGFPSDQAPSLPGFAWSDGQTNTNEMEGVAGMLDCGMDGSDGDAGLLRRRALYRSFWSVFLLAIPTITTVSLFITNDMKISPFQCL